MIKNNENDRLIKGFIKNPKFTVPVILTIVAGYFYNLVNESVGIDDLVAGRYIDGVLFSQGRFTSNFFHELFGFESSYTYANSFLGLIFLFFAAVLFCVTFKKASKDRLPGFFYTGFACLFVSYPLLNEIFVYNGADFNTCIGFFLCGVALLFADNCIEKYSYKDNKKQFIFNFVYSIITWFILMSLYEALAFVYVTMVGLLLFIKKPEKPFILKNILTYALPLLIGIALEWLFGVLVNAIFTFENVGSAGSSIVLLPNLGNIIYLFFRKFFLAGFWYLPIREFFICVVLSLAIFIISAIKHKKPSILLYSVAVYAGLFTLGILTEGCVKYRTCLAFAPFAAFIIAYAFVIIAKKFKTKAIRSCIILLLGILTINNALCLNARFQDNIIRWNEEKIALINAAETIQAADFYDEEKPVIFIGEYELSDNIMSRKYVRADNEIYVKIKNIANKFGFDLETTDYDETYVLATAQSDFKSLITWGTDDNYNCNEELLLVFRYLGFEFTAGTNEQYDELSQNAENFAYGVNDCGDYIVYRWN